MAFPPPRDNIPPSFVEALDTLGDKRLGLAVSGGGDSLAMLLFAASLGPDRLFAVTVDHGLRPSAAQEADFVAQTASAVGVSHDILTIDWPDGAPTTNVEARARTARYDAISDWARARDIGVVATAHHADDLAETMLMRLARGAGLSGLSAIRPVMRWKSVTILRPLLGVSKTELTEAVERAGLPVMHDPMNEDRQFDRVRLRTALADAGFADRRAYARSIANLADAEDAVGWSVARLAEDRIHDSDSSVTLDASGLPAEYRRRLFLEAIKRMGARPPRGPALMRAIAALDAGEQASLGDLLVRPTAAGWQLLRAPPRHAL